MALHLSSLKSAAIGSRLLSLQINPPLSLAGSEKARATQALHVLLSARVIVANVARSRSVGKKTNRSPILA